MLLWLKKVHSNKVSLSYLELISSDQSKFLPKHRFIFYASQSVSPQGLVIIFTTLLSISFWITTLVRHSRMQTDAKLVRITSFTTSTSQPEQLCLVLLGLLCMLSGFV